MGGMEDPRSILAHFGVMIDPRVDRTKEHKLVDILVIALCAVICGAEHFTEMEEFGQAKEEWFRTFLELPNGIPSHDTFGRVLSMLDPAQFQACFLNWAREIAQLKLGEVIAIDGKSLNGSIDTWSGKTASKIISAWATGAGLVIGQTHVPAGTNETAMVPELLKVLMLKGCIVTVDAANCQTKNAQLIVERGGDYVMALKENQGRLYADVEQAFRQEAESGFRHVSHSVVETQEEGHGRIETRRYTLIDDPAYRDYLNADGRWRGLGSICRVERTRRTPAPDGDKVEHHTAYYISSLSGSAEQLEHAIRAHWEVENGLHWRLDIAFREDQSRVRIGYAAENFAVIRHIALNLLKADKSKKIGVKSKRLAAGWDEAYLLRILASDPGTLKFKMR
jgi:predicted transposase YbfD/YdcC